MTDLTSQPPTPNPQTEATRAHAARPFAADERGDAARLFAHVADDVHRNVTGASGLSGDHRGKREFLETTYRQLATVLREPVRPRVRRSIADSGVGRDDAATHAGLAAIARANAPMETFWDTFEPLAVASEDGAIVVTNRVTGDFPGSRIDLQLADRPAGGKAASLAIG